MRMMKSISGVVYRIVSPSGKCYIGKTTVFNQRMRQHKRLSWIDSKKNQVCPKLCNAVKKYGWENMKVVKLAEHISCPVQLDKMEIMFINQFDSMNNGYNCTSGGDGGYKRTNDSKQRTSLSMIESYKKRGGHSLETKQKISRTLKETLRVKRSLEL